jgi:hypothetical protein
MPVHASRQRRARSLLWQPIESIASLGSACLTPLLIDWRRDDTLAHKSLSRTLTTELSRKSPLGRPEEVLDMKGRGTAGHRRSLRCGKEQAVRELPHRSLTTSPVPGVGVKDRVRQSFGKW